MTTGARGQLTVTVVLPANYGLVYSAYNNPYNLYSNNFDPGYFNSDDLQLYSKHQLRSGSGKPGNSTRPNQ